MDIFASFLWSAQVEKAAAGLLVLQLPFPEANEKGLFRAKN